MGKSYHKDDDKRDPSSHRTPAQIRKQVKGYNHRPDQIAQRSDNNKARAMMAKKGLVHKGDGKDVDHIQPQRKGGRATPGNLRVVSKSRNRGWADGKV